MTKSARTNQTRVNDRKIGLKEFNKVQDEMAARHLSGKTHSCELKGGQIQAAVCTNTQKTAGCKIGPKNKPELKGCSCWEQGLNDQSTKTPRKKKNSDGPVKLSYQAIMSAYFTDNGVADITQLVDAINSHPSRSEVKRLADAKNTSVGVSILRNPTRVKNPLNIQYSRITKKYYLISNKEAKAEYETDMAKIEADKKTKTDTTTTTK